MKKYSSSYSKLFKAALATSLATGAIVTVAPVISKADNIVNFKDVNESAHYYLPVLNLSARGIVKGYEDGTFKPNNSVTRGQAAKILALTLNLDTVNVVNPGFTDVDVSNEYYGPIAALAQAGIINGYADNTFKPNDKLKRSQMAKIIVLGFGLNEETLTDTRFTDVKSSDAYAGYVQAMLTHSITTGTTPTTFGPNSLVTRGQIASFVVRSEAAVPAKGAVEVESEVIGITNSTVELASGTYRLTADLKSIFNPSNLAALKGANVKVTTNDGVIEKVSSINLVANGSSTISSTIDGKGAVLTGDLKINADYVSIKNLTVEGNLEIGSEVKNSFLSDGITVKGKTIVSDEAAEKFGVQPTKGKMFKTVAFLSPGGVAETNQTANQPVITFSNSTLSTIEVSKNGITIDSKGSTSIQAFTLSANVHLKADAGVTINRVVIAQGATGTTIDAVIITLTIDTQSAFTLQGTGEFGTVNINSSNEVRFENKGKIGTIEITISNANVSFGSDIKIGNLVLPAGVVAKDLIKDFDKIKGNIDKIVGEAKPEVKPETPPVVDEGPSDPGPTQGEVDRNAAAQVSALISALPEAANVTLSSKQQINAARVAYERLTAAQKALVNISKLSAAEVALSLLDAVEVDRAAAAKVTALINAIPANITLEHKGQITAARAAFDKLTPAQKVLVNLDKLVEAEKAMGLLDKEFAAKAAFDKKVIEEFEKINSDLIRFNNELSDASKLTFEILSPEKSLVEIERTGLMTAFLEISEIKSITIGDTTIDLHDENGALINPGATREIGDAILSVVTGVTKLGGLIDTPLLPIHITVNGSELEFTSTYNFDFVGEQPTAGDRTAATHVTNLISALPEPQAITVKDQNKISEARAAFEALTVLGKTLVKTDKLDKAEVALDAAIKTEAEDKAAAKLVDELIVALPNVENVVVSDEATINEARFAYDKLTPGQKVFVENTQKLEAVEKALADRKLADAVIVLIEALPSETVVNVGHKVQIEAANAAFEKLTADQKLFVHNTAKLTQALNALALAEKVANDKVAADHVILLISQISIPVTVLDREKINTARTAFQGLSPDQQTLVTNLEVLEAAETALAEADRVDQAAADLVNALIASLPIDDFGTDENRTKIQAARSAYNSLTATQKKLVDVSNLLAAEKEVADIDKTEADMAAAAIVNELINNLPEVSAITLEDEIQITNARTAFDALEPIQQALTNVERLLEAEAKIDERRTVMNSVISLIESLPAAGDITLAHKGQIEAARTAYESLELDQQKFVKMARLTEAEAALNAVVLQNAINAAQAAIDGLSEEVRSAANAVKAQEAIQSAKEKVNTVKTLNADYDITTWTNEITAQQLIVDQLVVKEQAIATAQTAIDSLPMAVKGATTSTAAQAFVDAAKEKVEAVRAIDAQYDTKVWNDVIDAQQLIVDPMVMGEKFDQLFTDFVRTINAGNKLAATIDSESKNVNLLISEDQKKLGAKELFKGTGLQTAFLDLFLSDSITRVIIGGETIETLEGQEKRSEEDLITDLEDLAIIWAAGNRLSTPVGEYLIGASKEFILIGKLPNGIEFSLKYDFNFKSLTE